MGIESIAIAFFCMCTLAVVGMTTGSVTFLRLLNTSQDLPLDEELPKAAIVMSIRGDDPSLHASITALLNQDYPDYRLQIVVDSAADPAWEPIQHIVEESGATNVNVLTLTERYSTCSLKCSALVQGISALDPSCEVIAIVDADMVAYPTWLRELVAPMKDPSVGVTSGTRWYMPQDGQYGSWVRYLWNVYGAVCMYIYRCPWGGSMAIRRSLFYEGGLLETWKKVLSDDNTASTAASRMGLKLNFVPTQILVNRETCDLEGCWRFVKRQYLWTKLYNPFWNVMALQTVTRVTTLTVGAVVLVAAIATWNLAALTWALAGFFAYSSAVVVLLLALELKARRIVERRESIKFSFSMAQVVKSLIAIPVSHVLSFCGMFAVMGMQTVEWRGVTYQIQDPLRVKLVDYLPYSHSEGKRELQNSIL